MHSIVKKEDFIEYRRAKEFRQKYQKKVDRFFFIPEEVHILSGSSSIMRKKKRIELKIFSGDIHFPGETDKISWHSGILIPPGTGKKCRGFKKIEKLDLCPTDHTYKEKVFCFGSTRSHI
ncbi:hypothetical protein MKW92_030927 [Papaver armeniacum]|nr:hypothetical protein MKW92_030927 [Papaver armeniacum]